MTQMTPSSVHAKYPATFTRPSDEESESRGAGNQARLHRWMLNSMPSADRKTMISPSVEETTR